MLLLLLLSRFSHVRLCATLWTAAHQAPHQQHSPAKDTGVGKYKHNPVEILIFLKHFLLKACDLERWKSEKLSLYSLKFPTVIGFIQHKQIDSSWL